MKWKKFLSVAMAFAVAVATVPMGGRIQTQAAETDVQEMEYEIYPTPHNIAYSSGAVALTDSADLVLDTELDQATKDRLTEVLDIKGIKGKEVSSPTGGKLNIVVAVRNSGSAAESYFNEKVALEDSELFNKVDSYALCIKDGMIAILGKDTDAAFYALSTLRLIFQQTPDKSVRALQMEDYAIGQYRGFIEGYYGIPWSVEDRISLMRFGGDFKMNVYVFAPKDDPYHNSQWRELYPDDKIEDIKKMVAAGTASKCRFVWAIHPFMNSAISQADYEADLKIVQDKFEQLYEAGVRQFCISADDANNSPALQAQLCKDMVAWTKAHEGTYNLMFVPQLYNTATGNWYGITLQNYYNNFKDIEDLEIMWTGDAVCSPATTSTFSTFANYANRDPLMWLNWPVNDVNHKRLVMGPAESCILNLDVTNFKGIVTNPLEQAEASKTSLFAIADWAWNTSDFDCQQSWADCFKYIEPGAAKAMHELCKHLTNPQPGGITGMGESVELAEYINDFVTAYNNGNGVDYKKEGQALIGQLDKIVSAADEFQTKGVNVNLQDEMKPWVDSLRYLSRAVTCYIDTEYALSAGDNSAAWDFYARALSNYTASKNCQSPILEGTQMVEAGALKIMPLAENLDSVVRQKMFGILENPSFGTQTNSPESGSQNSQGKNVFYSDNIGTIYRGSGSNVTDASDTTFLWFEGNVKTDEYIGVDLGAMYKLDMVHVLQGGTASNGANDYFRDAVLEYSEDNENWKQLGTETYGTTLIESKVFAKDIKAQYVRLRSRSDGSTWFCIRDFCVYYQEIKDNLYTNVDSLKTTEVQIRETASSVPEMKSVTLGGGEYVGLKLPFPRAITELNSDYTGKDALSLEYSVDEMIWNKVPESFEQIDAKYVRIINKGTEEVAFDLNGLSFTSVADDRTAAAEPGGEEAHRAVMTADSVLPTFFEAAEGAGQLIWTQDAAMASKLYILQDPDTISNARVSVRLADGEWQKIGYLRKGLNRFEGMEICGPFGEVKVEWQKNGPRLYEIYTVGTERTLEQAFEECIASVETADSSLYTADSYQACEDALKAARNLDVESASDDELRAAIAALYRAANSLVTKKQEELAQKVEEADKIVKENTVGNQYTEESWQHFWQVYEEAKDKMEYADQDEVDELLKRLEEARGKLTKKSTVTSTPSYPSQGTQIGKGYTTTVRQLRYRVTDAAKKLVAVYGPKNKNMKTVKIPASIKIDKVSYKVTEISKNAFAKMGKLTKVTIGANVQKIGKKAFANDKKLKTIDVKSKVLRKVANNILTKSYARGFIKVPKKQKAKYKKLFKKIGKKKIK